MKVLSNKEQQREKLEREMQRYLARGGRVLQVPNGASGQGGAVDVRDALPFVTGPRTSRTDLSALAAAIDARKPSAAARRHRRRRQPQRPRRKLIYDDFGEPLRWVWDHGSDS